MSYRLYVPTTAEEEIEDIFYGQINIIGARWFLIAGVLLLTLWGAHDVRDVQIKILPIIALIALNFYLHGRYMMERPAGRALIWLSSLIDLLVISAVISLGLPQGQFGLDNPLFIFYYPVLLAFALVFARLITAIGISMVCLAYAGICLFAGLEAGGGMYALVLRLVTLVATGIVGAMYWRIQREARRKAQTARGSLLHEVTGSGIG
ncbi:MAG: hypothetical protein V3R16_03180 [Nitrospirales bacterium]